jgi:type VI secretion system protein ImpH
MVGQKLKVKICPCDYLHYLRIYNDPRMINAIDHLVCSYMGVNGKYHLLIKINSQYLPRVRLSSDHQQAFKVGISVWIASRVSEIQFVEMPLTVNKGIL